MMLVETSASVFQALQAIKQQGRGFVTNFFLSGPKLESWIARHELTMTTSEDSALLLRREGDFSHLYFFATDSDRLQAALAAFLAAASGIVVADLVGREDEIRASAEALNAAGFSDYVRFIRFRRLSAGQPQFEIDPEVEFAQAADAEPILLMLQTFDRFANQLPLLDEVRDAIARHGILVVRGAGKIAGLFYYDVEGLTCTYRYWLVDPEFRGRKLGLRLMRSSLAACSQVRRVTSFILDNNDQSINMHKGFGFEPDGLTDRVMIWKRTAA